MQSENAALIWITRPYFPVGRMSGESGPRSDVAVKRRQWMVEQLD